MFRRHGGEWLGGFAENMGCCTSTKAKLKAVLRGLKLARTLGFTKLWVNLDSSCVVGFIRGAFNLPIEHWNLIKQCRELIADSSWEVHISHCFREANRVADKLANIGVGLDTQCMFYDTPIPVVQDLLFADSIGCLLYTSPSPRD